jgi:hypothetical protein
VCRGAVGKGPLIFIDEDLNAEKYVMYSKRIAYLYSKRAGKPNWRVKSGSNQRRDEDEEGHSPSCKLLSQGTADKKLASDGNSHQESRKV